MVRVFIGLVLLFCSSETYASSCCGQSSSSYTVLFLGQKSAVNMGTGYTEVEGRVFSGSNEFHIWGEDKKAYKKRLSLDWAYSFSTRHQVFSKMSFFENNYEDSFGEENSSSVSDAVLGYSYEILPEYTYSKWKPVVYVSSFINLPFGVSAYDKKSLSEGAGVTGHDQFGAGLGVSVRKVFYPLTVLAQVKAVRLLGKTFDGMKVSGFYDGSASFLVSYASPFWNLGVSSGLTWSYLSKREIFDNRISSDSSDSVTFLVSAQKVLNEEMSLTVAYSDQTILGTPQNTLLSKVYSLNLNYNFF
ncbi:MAG: hypothetical protein ACRBBP_04055 [Bdellovibrionales bacterium]